MEPRRRQVRRHLRPEPSGPVLQTRKPVAADPRRSETRRSGPAGPGLALPALRGDEQRSPTGGSARHRCIDHAEPGVEPHRRCARAVGFPSHRLVQSAVSVSGRSAEYFLPPQRYALRPQIELVQLKTKPNQTQPKSN